MSCVFFFSTFNYRINLTPQTQYWNKILLSILYLSLSPSPFFSLLAMNRKKQMLVVIPNKDYKRFHTQLVFMSADFCLCLHTLMAPGRLLLTLIFDAESPFSPCVALVRSQYRYATLTFHLLWTHTRSPTLSPHICIAESLKEEKSRKLRQ